MPLAAGAAVSLTGLRRVLVTAADVQESCTIEVMPVETTYTSLRANLASVLDQVIDQQETVIVRRRGGGTSL
jgi:hypothetical protein